MATEQNEERAVRSAEELRTERTKSVMKTVRVLGLALIAAGVFVYMDQFHPEQIKAIGGVLLVLIFLALFF